MATLEEKVESLGDIFGFSSGAGGFGTWKDERGERGIVTEEWGAEDSRSRGGRHHRGNVVGRGRGGDERGRVSWQGERESRGRGEGASLRNKEDRG